jgi:hypothetical protein
MTATPQDLAAIDRLINPEPPERIYGWVNTQLSLASHSSGCTYNGHQYKIAYHEKGQPLVRSDVIKREEKEKDAKWAAVRQAQKQAAQTAQGELL